MLRTTLWLSLDPSPGTRGQLPLRGGRAIGWITDALRPLDDDGIPGRDIVGLAMAIRSACGIESLVWLTDVAGQSRVEAAPKRPGSMTPASRPEHRRARGA